METLKFNIFVLLLCLISRSWLSKGMSDCLSQKNYIHVRTYVCMYLCTYVRTYVCMYVCMYSVSPCFSSSKDYKFVLTKNLLALKILF